MFGAGGGDWQRQRRDAVSAVLLCGCILTVIQDGHRGVSAGILSLVARIHPGVQRHSPPRGSRSGINSYQARAVK